MNYCYVLCIATISAINILFSFTSINGSHRRTQDRNSEFLKPSSKAHKKTKGGELNVSEVKEPTKKEKKEKKENKEKKEKKKEESENK